MTAALDAALSDVGYGWSQDSTNEEDRRSQRWYISEPRDGTDGSGFQAVAFYLADGTRLGSGCDVQVDLHGTRRVRAQAAWRSFLLFRDGILPETMPGAGVRGVDHPGSRGRAWEVRGLAARFAPSEALPREVRERVEAHEARWAFVRWGERTASAAWATWTKWGAEPPWERPGHPLYGPSMYFAYPKSWFAFGAFALAVVLGCRLWLRPGKLRTAGFLAVAMLLLMPVKVPTFVGWIYLPHGFIQAFDFDPRYYFREAPFALAAALCNGVVAWLMLRLSRCLVCRCGRRWTRSEK